MDKLALHIHYALCIMHYALLKVMHYELFCVGGIVLLRLPVCPHCHAVYTYKEVSDMHSGNMICYHCKKKFSVRKLPGAALWLSVICTLLVIFNLVIIFSTDNFTVVPLIADLAAVTAAVLLLPLTVRFRAEKITKSEKQTLREKEDNKQARK